MNDWRNLVHLIDELSYLVPLLKGENIILSVPCDYIEPFGKEQPLAVKDHIQDVLEHYFQIEPFRFIGDRPEIYPLVRNNQLAVNCLVRQPPGLYLRLSGQLRWDII